MISGQKLRGFTLLELLVVMGVLAVLIAIVAIAVNPYEQISRAQDYSEKTTLQDFINVNQEYLLSKKDFPWIKNSNCAAELASGGLLSQMTNCLDEVAGNGASAIEYKNKDELKHIYASKCGDTMVLCYNPKSKIENEDAETSYSKFGVNQPGCPAAQGTSADCYWCKPVIQDASCHIQPSPTPTNSPSPTPGPTATPTPLPIPNLVPGYANDQTKLLRTYAVFFFDYPGFPPPPGAWDIQLSLRSDFGGDYTQTNTSFASATDYTINGPANASYTAYRRLTSKYVGFQSLAGLYPIYANNCGKTVYYRVTNWYNPSATNKLEGPTYTAVIDCTTQVGVVDPPLSWYTVYDQLNGVQKQYDSSWDFDATGYIDWTDYWLGAFSTKTRYGGWQPPE